MTDFLSELKSKLTDLAGSWASYSALGSFALYLLGYLCVRFHLTTLGVGTDLAVLDERYLFTGAKFLVYLTSTFPIIVLIVFALLLVFALPAYGVLWLYRKLVKGSTLFKKIEEYRLRLVEWITQPRQLAILGIIISVVMIQFVMRQCYFFSNLLLAQSIPPTGLNLQALLVDEDGGIQSLFFAGLLASAILTAALLYFARLRMDASSPAKFLVVLLAILVTVQILLLPVNYGVFILDKEIPRVSNLGNDTGLKPGEAAWLVWEGTHGMTYLVETWPTVQGTSPSVGKRTLVTLPKTDLKRLEIQRYDQILRYIFVR